MLDELGLKKDREGNPRTAYSLRHTYISMRLMEGADIYQIAKNCRTSVEMIEKFYAAHIKHMIDASAVNIRMPRPNGRGTKRGANAPRSKFGREIKRAPSSDVSRALADAIGAGIEHPYAGVVELVDVPDLKSGSGDRVSVRFRPPAPLNFR